MSCTCAGSTGVLCQQANRSAFPLSHLGGQAWQDIRSIPKYTVEISVRPPVDALARTVFPYGVIVSPINRFVRDRRRGRLEPELHRLGDGSGDLGGGISEGRGVEVGIDGGGGTPPAPERAPDGGQTLAVHHALGREAVSEVVNAHRGSARCRQSVREASLAGGSGQSAVSASTRRRASRICRQIGSHLA